MPKADRDTRLPGWIQTGWIGVGAESPVAGYIRPDSEPVYCHQSVVNDLLHSHTKTTEHFESSGHFESPEPLGQVRRTNPTDYKLFTGWPTLASLCRFYL